MLPQCYPKFGRVHHRLRQWSENEMMRAGSTELGNALREEGAIDESECYINATFASTKGGGNEIEPTKHGKGVKIIAIADRHGLLLAGATRPVTTRAHWCR